jgi:hypothetical protein
MTRIEGRLARVLRMTQRVVTRAVFWKIPHNTPCEDVRLKIGRYVKPENFNDDEYLETLEPKSELTLDQNEFKALIDFLQVSYEPFRQGVKAFIPLDKPFEAENASQIKALFSLPDKQAVIKFILINNVIPNDLVIGLRQAHRVKAINKFELMLQEDLLEGAWQKWFSANSWVLGSEFVRILDERNIDTDNISDFLVEAYDGFLDIVEIKRPGGNLNFWAANKDHGNYIPSTDLIKAITQASKYIYEVEREANSVKFRDRVGGVKTVKPRCVLVFGRSDQWDKEQIEAYRILNASFHNLNILTYDHVLDRARRIVGLQEE